MTPEWGFVEISSAVACVTMVLAIVCAFVVALKAAVSGEYEEDCDHCFGWCPTCRAFVRCVKCDRVCRNGHVYPKREAMMKNRPERIVEAAQEVETALGKLILKTRERYRDLDDSHFNGAIIGKLLASTIENASQGFDREFTERLVASCIDKSYPPRDGVN